ncbi:MAG: DUF3592 domain-containing protein [bacterium]
MFIAGLIFLGIDLLILPYFIYRYLKYRYLKNNGNRYQGVIKILSDSDGGCQLLVYYQDSLGKRYQIKSSGSNSSWRNLEGKPAVVYYNRDNPLDAIIEDDFKFQIRLGLFLFTVFFLTSLVIIFFGTPQETRTEIIDNIINWWNNLWANNP